MGSFERRVDRCKVRLLDERADYAVEIEPRERLRQHGHYARDSDRHRISHAINALKSLG
jgi:hypothetical protein